MAKVKLEIRVPLKLSNWPFPEFQNSRIPEFQNPEFWDPGILEFWKWPEKREKMADFPQRNGFLAVAYRLLLRKPFIFPEKLAKVWENPVSGTALLERF